MTDKYFGFFEQERASVYFTKKGCPLIGNSLEFNLQKFKLQPSAFRNSSFSPISTQILHRFGINYPGIDSPFTGEITLFRIAGTAGGTVVL